MASTDATTAKDMSVGSTMSDLLDRCQLLELPVELQDQIFELAVIERDPIIINSAEYRAAKGWKKQHVTNRCQPALSRTCTMIRKQALKIFYSHNLFLANYDTDGGRKIILEWLRMIGPENRKNLASFRLYNTTWNIPGNHPRMLVEFGEAVSKLGGWFDSEVPLVSVV
ncbi:hypothetical protein LTR08_008444 [Meristemomyces frigidus]|nr:hypothetical protein LTR08_008444 [Meristemomyces frigidus]